MSGDTENLTKFLKTASEMIKDDPTVTKYKVGSKLGLDPNETTDLTNKLKEKGYLKLKEIAPMEQVAKRSDFEITEEGKKITNAG